MKNTLMFVLMLLSMSSSIFAEKITDVSLRSIRQDNMIRVVIEADDDFIRDANTNSSAGSMRVDFPSSFNLIKPADLPYEAVKKGRTLVITPKEPSDVRAYKLTSPARVVIELKAKPRDAVQKQEQQPQQEKPKPDTLKPQKEASPQQMPQKQADVAAAADRQFKFRTVVIDPGHGGHDYGIFHQDSREKEISLQLARDLLNMLQKKGSKAFLTRKVDQSSLLEERIGFSNSKTPDLFISLHATPLDHFVITTSASVDETEVDATVRLYRLSSRQSRHIEKSRSVAKSLGDALKTEYKSAVIYRELPLSVLASLDAPAVFLEYPFAAHKSHDPKVRERLVNAVVKGLAARE